MAGRKQKNNATWYPCDAGFHAEERMIVVRGEFGMAGLGIVTCLRGMMVQADCFRLDFSDARKRVLSASLGVDRETLIKVVECVVDMGLFQTDGLLLWSDELIDDLSPLTDRRERQRDRRQKSDVKGPISPENTPNNYSTDVDLCASNTTQITFEASQMQFEASQIPHSTIHNNTVHNNTDESNVSSPEEKNLKNLSLSSMTAEDSRKPPSSGGERETFFDFLEIFFFSRLPSPLEEAERFVNHYEKTGWRDANGNPIWSRAAAARAWQPKKGEKGDDRTGGALPKEFVDAWEEGYHRVKLLFPDNAWLLLTIRHVEVKNRKMTITFLKKESELLKPHWANMREHFWPLFIQKLPHYQITTAISAT